ncbi:LexA family protein [Pisciglobus halotolerans]|uniref:Repressor LexA n=1 Tax=Pisciglobus halotolerans TaxID=745365 RepID=A0A1I3BJ25_9LACT|nr:XRE family transcriptional regulator [Pisciglobus halotolerans]SFH62305.1 repressor LexA [Pisciglobus halotolerans]
MARGELTPIDKEHREIISNKINELLEETGRKQIDLSKFTGIPRSTITGYVKGTSTPNPGNVQKIANFFNVKKSDIDPRYTTGTPSNVVEVSKVIPIPILGTIACGEPITAEENIEGYKERTVDDLPSGELFYLNAKGDSMWPTISNGSLVLCKQQPDVESGEIAAVLVNDDTEATLKRVRKVSDMIILEPINDDYDPYIINEKNPARIVGKALEVVSKL